MTNFYLKFPRVAIVLIICAFSCFSFPSAQLVGAQSEPPQPTAESSDNSQAGDPSPAELAQSAPRLRWELFQALENVSNQPDPVLQAEVITPFERAGVSSAIDQAGLTLRGEAGIEQLQSVLFDYQAAGVDYLGGAAELTIQLVSDGAPLELNLEARITAGYEWVLLGTEGIPFTQIGEPAYETRYPGYGAPAVQTIRLKPGGIGASMIHLQYRRPFEPDEGLHASLVLFIDEPAYRIDLIDPTPTAPQNQFETAGPGEKNAIEQLPQPKGLPAAFDWRSRGIVPAVRQQGSCGSCWAFGTVGIFESALRKVGGPLMDLSEQFLVSCNRDGWSCDGGFTAHKYHYSSLGSAQSQIGAVLEADMPYTTSNGSCTTAVGHPYRLHNWKFVTGSEWTVPTVAQIKTAIYTYGPVTAAICAGSAFLNYSGGIFQTNENICGGSTNHQIILVGWNDSTGTWILRNSHGPNWGESGYMRIKYGTSRVGEGLSWVIPGPTPLSPGAYTTDRTPTFKWNKVAGASSYQLQVYKGTTLKINKTISNSTCVSACEYTPATLLDFGNYQWKVRAKEGLLWKAYSANKQLSVVSTAGFNSQFNGSMLGWTRKAGANWNVSGSVMYTYGTNGKWSSVYRSTSPYANFDYTARVYRSGGVVDYWYPASYITVRMGDKVGTSDNWWYPGYYFGYINNGYFAIWQTSDTGSSVALQDWTYSSAIVQNGWNKLRVIGQGGTFYFYINNTLVRTVSNPYRKAGYVGLAMYNHANTVSTQLMVDYATLNYRTSAAAAPALQIDPAQQALNQAALQSSPNGSPEGMPAQ